MNMMKQHLIGFALTLALTSAAIAGGGKALSSPRGKADRTKVVAGETTETMDRSFAYGSPRAMAEDASRKAKAGTTKDTLQRSSVGITAKVRSQRNTKAGETQVAPK